MELKNLVAFIKNLKFAGYTQAEICLITKQNKSFVHRIWHNKSFHYVSRVDYIQNTNLEKHKEIFDYIKTAPEIPGMGPLSDNDKSYIRLLKLCQIPYEKIKSLYSDRPVREIRNIWSYGTDISIRAFDSTLINIPKKIYLNFLPPLIL
jgi:hypothetical protein